VASVGAAVLHEDDSTRARPNGFLSRDLDRRTGLRFKPRAARGMTISTHPFQYSKARMDYGTTSVLSVTRAAETRSPCWLSISTFHGAKQSGVT